MVERPMLYSAPALKHGAYSGMGLLPGENPDEFKKLLEDLIAELNIDGPSEHVIALKLAHVTWREQHLVIYGYAAQARKRYSEIRSELVPQASVSDAIDRMKLDAVLRLEKRAAEKAMEELGSAWRLIEMGDVLTLEHLSKELEIAERLSRQKERLLKQLMFARGVKSLSLSASTSAAPPLVTTRALSMGPSPQS